MSSNLTAQREAFLQAKLQRGVHSHIRAEILARLSNGPAPRKDLLQGLQFISNLALRELCELGLVTRYRGGSDGREMIYELTSTGSQDSALASSDRNAKIAP